MVMAKTVNSTVSGVGVAERWGNRWPTEWGARDAVTWGDDEQQVSSWCGWEHMGAAQR